MGEGGVNTGVAMEAAAQEVLELRAKQSERQCVCVLLQTWSDLLTTEDVGVRGKRQFFALHVS